MADDSFTITLSGKERTLLLHLIGYATQAACRDGDFQLAYRILDFANRANKNNPEWKPYKIPDEFKSAANN
jgi:hypothetical protein